MTFKALLRRARVTPVETLGDGEVSSVSIDSRRLKAGALFVCMPGMTRESEGFLPDAKANGAVAALVHSQEGLLSAKALGLAVALIPPDETHFSDAVARVCDAFFNHPTRHMKVVGITGTNGKTTTAWLVRDMLRHLGLKTAYLGTLGFHLPGEERELNNTTPFAVDLYNMLAEARNRGVEALAMEVSSHALAQHRVEHVEFDVTLFTNLTQDHLDFHGTMEAYEAAKWRLFDELPRQTHKRTVGAINLDDPRLCQRWSWSEEGGRVTYGTRWWSDLQWLRGNPVSVGVDHLVLEIETRGPNAGRKATVRVPLGGLYNVENALSAFAAVTSLGVNDRARPPRFEFDRLLDALAHVRPVPGRFEAVPNDAGIGILVDYAHTPDGLKQLLASVRPVTRGRVITVFGCGGDRDRTKRPLMAQAAGERSDIVVLTSDNPRTEDPEAILREVETGVPGGVGSRTIVDRPEAVAWAVREARPGDVVVIAGKGHENYQIVGREKRPMDDRELARAGLAGK